MGRTGWVFCFFLEQEGVRLGVCRGEDEEKRKMIERDEESRIQRGLVTIVCWSHFSVLLF